MTLRIFWLRFLSFLVMTTPHIFVSSTQKPLRMYILSTARKLKRPCNCCTIAFGNCSRLSSCRLKISLATSCWQDSGLVGYAVAAPRCHEGFECRDMSKYTSILNWILEYMQINFPSWALSQEIQAYETGGKLQVQRYILIQVFQQWLDCINKYRITTLKIYNVLYTIDIIISWALSILTYNIFCQQW